MKQLPDGMDDHLKSAFILLERIPMEIKVPPTKHTWNRDIPIIPTMIGFCGKFYPAMNINGITYHSVESVVSSLPNKVLKDASLKREQLREMVNKKHRGPYGGGHLADCKWEGIIADCEKNEDTTFIGLKCPIFRLRQFEYSRYQFTLNPQLKEDQFQKVKHPVDCFQEISMYLGNQLAVQTDPTTVIADKDLIVEKGFDDWSFRKMGKNSKR